MLSAFSSKLFLRHLTAKSITFVKSPITLYMLLFTGFLPSVVRLSANSAPAPNAERVSENRVSIAVVGVIPSSSVSFSNLLHFSLSIVIL